VANRFATGKIALGICDRCGFEYYLKELRKEIVKGTVNNLKVCPECFDPDHPQLHLGEFPVDDPQALRDPRPDSAGYAESRAQIIPVSSVISFGRVGAVTVTTT
jgi:hypothetical protein